MADLKHGMAIVRNDAIQRLGYPRRRPSDPWLKGCFVMSMDSSGFPYVWFSYADGFGDDEGMAEFERNLPRQKPFVILSDSAPDENRQPSHEERKRLSLWMKAHKADLRQFVLAMVVVEPNAVKRLAFAAFGVIFEKFWGYPMVMVESRDAAMAQAETLLAKVGR